MNDLITEARELCEKATPGPWEVVGKDAWRIEGFPQVEMNTPDGKYFPVHNDTDAAFIARSRTLIPELCDALEKALTELDRLTEAQRWIPVTERLPDEFCDALLTDGKDFFVGFYRPDADAWDNSHMGWVRQGEDENGHANCVKITHWMPLPAAPEEGE